MSRTITLKRLQVVLLLLLLLFTMTRVGGFSDSPLGSTSIKSTRIASSADTLKDDLCSTSAAPLAEVDSLLRGMNMVSSASSRGFWFNSENGTLIWESVEPYWFRRGFNETSIRADLNTLLTMGVRYIRVYALIFQFIEWHPTAGYVELNASSITSFNIFLDELAKRGMILTVTFMAPLWSLIDHPSLLQYYRVFNSSSGMNPEALTSLRSAMVDFVEAYRFNDVIFSWDLVGGFSDFIARLKDPINGFGLDVDVGSVFSFIQTTADDIRDVDDKHLVTMSDYWPQSFGEDSWLNGYVPPFYNESLPELVDYVSVLVYSDNSTLPILRYLAKPVVISEIASTQQFNRSRRANSRMLLDTYADAIDKHYSGFTPWAFSHTVVAPTQQDLGDENPRYHWTWDALLLFSLYRDDTVSFLSTSDYSLLSSQPVFDIYGHVTMELFLPEDINQNGIMVRLASRNLIMSPSGTTNTEINTSVPVYGHIGLDVLGLANTLVEVSQLGLLTETGIRVENCSSWTSSVVHYQSRRAHFILNSSKPADVIIENGLFNLVATRNYRIVKSSLSSGVVWESLAQANQRLELCFSVEEGSVLIKVTPFVDLLNLFSVGASIIVILISVVVYCYMDRRR